MRNSDRRRAVKLYLTASKLFEKEQFQEALQRYERAAALDPGNDDYALAVKVARSHLVTALIQAAAKDRLRGDAAAARADLARALELDPNNPQVDQHLNELGDDALLGQTRPLYEQGAEEAGAEQSWSPLPEYAAFTCAAIYARSSSKSSKPMGLKPRWTKASPPCSPGWISITPASRRQCASLQMVTNSFYVPLDAHRVLVAKDDRENRLQFTRQDLETVYLSGLNETELNEVANLAKNVFDAQQAVDRLQLRDDHHPRAAADPERLQCHLSQLLDGQSQVMLEVRLIQLAHTSERKTGVQPPQSVSAFNVYSEEQSILNANQAWCSRSSPRVWLPPATRWRFLASCLLPARSPVLCSPTASPFSAAGSPSPRWLPDRYRPTST